MRIAYFDCFSGASGDMLLGALLAAGLSEAALRGELGKLGLSDYELTVRQVQQKGMAATKVDIASTGPNGHRHLADICRIIDRSNLDPVVKQRARQVFNRLAAAEAKVHGIAVEKVHFHEVGAVDAIVDVVGSVAGLHLLDVNRVVCSTLPVGSGTVVCEHGVLPVPAPATAELLVGVPLADCDEPGELLTPTGAAILTTLADAYGPCPPMVLKATGCGAGSREGRARPNLLRLLIGEASGASEEADEVVGLETNLDNTTGEQIGYAFEALFAAGALDVFTAAVTMKKNRPGVLLTVLAPLDRRQACEDVMLAETGTLGVRRHVCARRKLSRKTEQVETRYGLVRMKLGLQGANVISASPEYEDCAAAARRWGVSLGAVMAEVRHAYRSARPEGQP